MYKDLLENDHAEVDQLYKEVVDQLDSGRADGVLERLDLFWARLAVHIRAEHLHLFPAALRLAAGMLSEEGPGSDIPDVIARLRHDHDSFMYELAHAIKALRALAMDDHNPTAVLADVLARLAAVKQDLDRHNRLEEERIYILEELPLKPAEHEELERLIRRELANMPSRFTVRDSVNLRLEH